MRNYYTQADIERLYSDPDAPAVEFSDAMVEHHIRRGRVMRAQAAAELFGAAGRSIKRLFGGSGRSAQDHGHGDLKPSSV